MGRLPAHSDHRWYQNEAELARKTMALRQSLNGEWQFAHSPNPAARPADFWKEEADRSAFGRIQVPAPARLERRAGEQLCAPVRSEPGSGGQAGLHLSGRGGVGVLSVAERPVHRLQ